MAAFIEERKMSRKKSNRLSLEQHKRTYRENQAAIAKALEQNAELEKAITEEENLEIVGIIRKYRVGIDNLEQSQIPGRDRQSGTDHAGDSAQRRIPFF